ncbi:MAG: alpha/beta hydrolase [Verrucomicrobiota bacterium]|jgi:pimeloyl-ACP methyl ester carboxylesterase
MNHSNCRPAGPSAAFNLAAILVAAKLWCPMAAMAAETLPAFTGEKTLWHGFDRYDFVLDGATLSITPVKAPPNEGDGVGAPAKDERRCIIVVPKQMAAGNPWSWRGCYWNHMPQAEIELLNRGFCVAYISADANLKPGKEWDAWYGFLTEQHGLSRKPAFIGMSRGGEYSYMWATTHPDEVSCIYADNPGGNPEILMRLGRLAQYDVPLLHVCGSLDPILGKYSTAIENIYQQFGGRISVMVKDGAAHHPHSLRDPTPIADFITQSVQETTSAPPAFVTGKFTKSAYYSEENLYRNYPQEGVYVTCRGPLFVPGYDRYQFNVDNVGGAGLNVIVPKTPAPGNPWVFRADFVGRDEVVDQALLAQGFHIVTGPVPYDDGPVPAQWDATYKYLTAHGFSRKPVMEGDGAAAGEAYAWALANPDEVSCIYGENPIMHSNLSKIPLLDRLGILAKAGVPLISVCGNLDPGLDGNTRVIEQRYKALGGQITVIVKEGQGHYPLAPQDPKPVVDLIVKSAAR